MFAALAGWGFLEARKIVKSDPFADFRTSANQQNIDQPVVTLRDTKLRGYQDDKLILTADADSIAISRDRNVYVARQLTKGEFKENEKTTWAFQADRGVWQDQVKSLALEGNIQAKTEDFDLKLQKLEYSNLTQDLVVPVPIKGKFFKGDVEAKNLKINLKTKKWEMNSILWTGALSAQIQDVPLPKRERWVLTGKSGFGEKDRSTWLVATARSTDVEIRADKIEQFTDANTKKEVIIASGNVRYFSPEANLLCDRVTAFREERRAILEGRVTMLIKPESDAVLKPEPLQPMRPVLPEEIGTRPGASGAPSGTDSALRQSDNLRRYPVRVLAERIEYWYRPGERKALITGRPQARQELPDGEWRMVWAPRAEWNGETDRLNMIGTEKKQEVRMRASNGDAYRCDTFTMSTLKDVTSWSMSNGTGEMEIEEDELPTPGSGSSGGGVSPPPNPGLSGPISGRT